MRDALLALAARCETEGPSRELDVAIQESVGNVVTFLLLVPEYTTSLDAAVTLAPWPCYWALQPERPPKAELRWRATVWAQSGRGGVFEGLAATEEQARCAAALRARAAAEVM